MDLLADVDRMNMQKNTIKDSGVNDADSGAGNFLDRALERSTNPDVPLLFLDQPYVDLRGQAYEQLSLRHIQTIADDFASFYWQQGVSKKDTVGVFFEDGIDYLIQYFALVRLGAIPAFVNGSMSNDIAARYLARVEVRGVMTDATRLAAIGDVLKASHPDVLLWNRQSVAKPSSGTLPNYYPFAHGERDPVLITHSSGTTGMPKAVVAAHAPFFHGVNFRLGRPLQGVARYLCALPLSHNSSVACIAEPLMRGCAVRIQAMKGPQSILRAIETFQPNIVVAFPKQLVEMCRYGLHKHDLSSVHFWRSTGDAAHERHIKMLTSTGGGRTGAEGRRGSTYIDGLGSSEMGSSLFYVEFTSDSPPHLRRVGKPQPWVEAEVLDEHSKPLGPRTVGRLAVRSPSLTTGYWNNSNLTEKFRESGYWITGDLVYKDEEGNFFHVDRITDMLQTREGTLYSVLTEEQVLNSFPEIFDCAIFGVPETNDGTVVPAIQVDLIGGRRSQDELHGLLERINVFLLSKAIPRMGKIVQNQGEDAYAPEGVTGKVLKRCLRERPLPAQEAIVIQ